MKPVTGAPVIPHAQIVNSRYKHLVVSGCSFTSNAPCPNNGPWNWPNHLAEYAGMTVHNLAIPGAGNDHIARSIILYLEHTQLPPEETLVLVMWSGVGRIDWITDKKLSQFGQQYQFDYYYDEYNELSLGGNWWNADNPTHLTKTIIEYSKYQSDQSLTLATWLNMENCANYLKVHNYDYYYTSFVNYKFNNIKGDALLVPFFGALEQIGLKLDQSHWLDLADTDYWGDWARKNDLIDPNDDFHPAGNSVERWPKEVLIPLFIKMKIFEPRNDIQV